ncbi:MAG TPA: histidine--tRNA ligase [Rhodanobacteraceae bacterium]|nr:histidine--tRNA ligase [Rhodanobacteraceae bacterium]
MALTPARSVPGVLELLPAEQIAFQRMLDTIRATFTRYGFLPVETPVLEHADVLLTKTGGETERQVYFVQSTGALERGDAPDVALRFDLTVPLARYVAEHERELQFPFRRYQIQRVYRGERPQRGRFREFYQCDIDVIGKDSLSIHYDAEIPAVIHSVFSALDFGPFTIQLNHRKLMRGFFEGLGIDDGERQTLVLREVDKLDKRGAGPVRETLTGKAFGLSTAVVDRILEFVQVRSSSLDDALAKLDALGAGSETFEQGRLELKEVLGLIHAFGVPEANFALNLSIARGLDYYTGMVYETTLDEHRQIGSICSGGRYDNLASQYTRSKLPGVGISIGATRLFWQLREADLLRGAGQSTVQALVTQMDATYLPQCLALAGELRDAGIATEVALEGGKLGRQFKYADRAGIPLVLVLGESELTNGTVTLKDLRSNAQQEVPRAGLLSAVRAALAGAGAAAGSAQ